MWCCENVIGNFGINCRVGITTKILINIPCYIVNVIFTSTLYIQYHSDVIQPRLDRTNQGELNASWLSSFSMCQLLEPKYRTTKLWCIALFYSFKRLLVTIKKLPKYDSKMLISKLSKNIEIIFVNVWNKNPLGSFCIVIERYSSLDEQNAMMKTTWQSE